MEQRLLYYADFQELIEIIQANWRSGFDQCFGDKKRFDVYGDRLAAFRNPAAHSRALLPFESHLVLGMTGELRQVITLFLSSGAGDPEPEHFPRIEEVRDSFGSRSAGAASGGSPITSSATLRPGDVVSFVGRAWDPDDQPLQWEVYLGVRRERVPLHSSRIEFDWEVTERGHLRELVADVHDHVAPPVPSSKSNDDSVYLRYRILPPRRDG